MVDLLSAALLVTSVIIGIIMTVLVIVNGDFKSGKASVWDIPEGKSYQIVGVRNGSGYNFSSGFTDTKSYLIVYNEEEKQPRLVEVPNSDDKYAVTEWIFKSAQGDYKRRTIWLR